ncbi:MAG: alpha/beta hydrolase [Noviherbaspirillum sp.]
MSYYPTSLRLVNEAQNLPAETGPARPMRIGVKAEGDGPAVVLLHSSMASKSQWRSLSDSMRGTHRLIAIDLHGYGESAMPDCGETFSLRDEVRLVQSALAPLLAPGERYHLAGHSYGGGVALRLAHAEPERVRSLSLYEPTAFHLLDQRDPALQEIRAVAQATQDAVFEGSIAQGTERFIDYWSGSGAYAALSPSRQALLASLLPKVTLDFQALMNDPLRPGDYSRMDMPACLITGRHSPDCAHAIVAILAAVLPAQETHRIDAGHMAPLTHPELVNPLIGGFIRGVEAKARRPAMRTRARLLMQAAVKHQGGTSADPSVCA